MITYLKFRSVKRAIIGAISMVSAIWVPFIIASPLPENFANTEWYGVPAIISMLLFGFVGVGYGAFMVVDGLTDFDSERERFIRDHTPVGDRRRNHEFP